MLAIFDSLGFTELMIVVHPGRPDARVIRQQIVLSRDSLAHRFALSDADVLTEIPIPVPHTH